MSRVYSPAFVDRRIAQIDQMLEEASRAAIPLPCPDEFGQCRVSYQQWCETLRNRGQLRYVDGFWAGYTLAMGLPKS